MRIRTAHAPHPDRATLLAWMEGELSWWRNQVVGRHVRSCWQCKGQASELESIVCAVSLGIAQLPEPSRVEIAKAQWRFREACQQVEAARQPRGFTVRPAWRIAAAAIVATAGLAFVGSQLRLANPRPRPLPPTPQVSPPRPSQAAKVLPPESSRTPAKSPQPLLAPPVLEPAAPTSPAPSEGDLFAAEVQALAALHRSRFCLTSGITVRRAGPAIEVTGLVQSQDQRERVSGVLQATGYPHLLRVRLTDPAAGLDAALGSAVLTTAEKHVTPPIEAWLREHLRVGSRVTEREMFNLMNAVVRESEGVSSEAWAMRHLAEQFPVERTRHVSPELMDQLLQMVDDHAIALGNSLHVLEGRLGPLSENVSTTASESATHNEWQDQALALQQDAERAVNRLLESFSVQPAGQPQGSAAGARDFSALLTSVEGGFRRCLASTSELRSNLQVRSATSSH